MFPSDTDVRFAVLIASILFIYNALGDLVLIDRLKAVSLFFSRVNAIQAVAHTQTPQVLDAVIKAIRGCEIPFYFPHILFMISGVVLILGVTAVIYWLIPSWKLMR